MTSHTKTEVKVVRKTKNRFYRTHTSTLIVEFEHPMVAGKAFYSIVTGHKLVHLDRGFDYKTANRIVNDAVIKFLKEEKESK